MYRARIAAGPRPIARIGMIARESKIPSQPPVGSHPSAMEKKTMRRDTRTNGGVAIPVTVMSEET